MAEKERKPTDDEGSQAELAEEISRFVIALSEDAAKREAFIKDPAAFLSGFGLSGEARNVLAARTAGPIRAATGGARPSLVVIIILETVTTDVIVAAHT